MASSADDDLSSESVYGGSFKIDCCLFYTIPNHSIFIIARLYELVCSDALLNGVVGDDDGWGGGDDDVVGGDNEGLELRIK